MQSYKNSLRNSSAYFVVFELPTLLFTAVFGFMIEFLFELPFMVICILDGYFKKKRP
jgi:hypothetical protein